MRQKIRTKIFMVLLLSLIVLPLLILIVLALGGNWRFPNLWPKEWSLRMVREVLFAEQNLGLAVKNSLFIGFGATIMGLLIAIPAAKVLADATFYGKRLVELCVYLPLIIPSVSLSSGLQFSLIQWQLTGTYFGVCLVHSIFIMPYLIQILKTAFLTVNPQLANAAQLLGANAQQNFIFVTLPALKEGLIASATMGFIVSMSQYVPTFLIGGGRFITLPMLLIPYTQSGKLQWAAIYSLIFLVVTWLPLQGLTWLSLNKKASFRA